ncbi:MAG TPA: hypothetical protein VD973_21285 [Symbiobacteriaceae bacterium]|nr:hypothetical protein [Symbiobacteriaceae bacterium]
MNGWAWAWLGGLALLGWAPGLALSYGIAFALAVGVGWNGPIVFGAVYFGMLVFSLFLLLQMCTHFSLKGTERARFVYAGGTGLTMIWTAAHVGFRLWTGM